jgi:cob(I)alamin adenosyltransferase
MKIYTKTGDKGKTSLIGGNRVAKYHIRIEAYGTIDELNSHIGLIRDQNIDSHTKQILIGIQNNLFTLGAILATPPDKEKLKNGKDRLSIEKIHDNWVTLLEEEMDMMNLSLPTMKHFVLPGGHTAVSFCHIGRCVCRRAERICTLLHEESPINELILVYLNRLSDYLFVLARKLTIDNNSEEIKWIPTKNK